MSGIFMWVVVGAVAGYILAAIQKRDFRREWVNYLLLGMSGSAVGGMIYRMLGYPLGNSLVVQIAVAVGGAFVFLWIMDQLRRMQR